MILVDFPSFTAGLNLAKMHMFVCKAFNIPFGNNSVLRWSIHVAQADIKAVHRDNFVQMFS